MNEQQAEKLLHSMTGIRDEFIEEAAMPPQNRAVLLRRPWIRAAAGLCLTALLSAGVWRFGTQAGIVDSSDSAPNFSRLGIEEDGRGADREPGRTDRKTTAIPKNSGGGRRGRCDDR